MNFKGAAACWTQSVAQRLKQASWSKFSTMLTDHFSRDHQENLICQLFHIHQSGTVADYVDRFTELVDQLVAYDHTTDPLYYTTCFIDGLRNDIRLIVLVSVPLLWILLAPLQEEVAEPTRRRDVRRPDPGLNQKPAARDPLPLLPPPRLDKPASPPVTAVDDKRPPDPGKSTVDRFAALRASHTGEPVGCATIVPNAGVPDIAVRLQFNSMLCRKSWNCSPATMVIKFPTQWWMRCPLPLLTSCF